MLTVDRQDRITYVMSHWKRGIVGVATKINRHKWHTEDYETGEQIVAATLTKARFWLERPKQS